MAEIAPILEGDGPALTVVEVGGWPPRLRDFLPGREITVVDVAAGAGPGCARAAGTALPFPDRSFDLAASLDTLEHVEPADRPRFIAELCRVARSCVVVAAPFAAEAVAAADRAMLEFIRAQAGYEHPYLKEHVALAPPDLVETLTRLVDGGLDVQVVPSGRLDRWLFMMAAYYTLDADPALRPALPFVMEAYNRAFYDYDKAEPAYRHFLVGAYAGLGRRWSRLAELATGPGAEAVDSRSMVMVLELARTLALKVKDREAAALAAQLADKDRELAALTERAAALEDFMVKVKSLPLYSFYEKFVKPRRPR